MPMIYWVDPNPQEYAILGPMLRQQGYTSYYFPTAEEFLMQDCARQSEPSCMLLETNLPRLSGLALFQRRPVQIAGMPAILMTSTPDTGMIVQAMKLGAFDFLRKPFDAERMLERVRAALDEHASQLQILQQASQLQTLIKALSLRERQVLQLLVQALNTKEIAHRLRICVKSVSRHRMHLLEKLNCNNEISLLLQLFHTGLIEFTGPDVQLHVTSGQR